MDVAYSIEQTDGILVVSEVQAVDVGIVGGFSTDGDNAVSHNIQSVLDVLRIEQRLSYFGFPGETTELAVNGTMDPDTQHAISLFCAAAADTEFILQDELNDAGRELINATRAPRWVDLDAAAFAPVGITFTAASNADETHGTNWLIQTIVDGANAAAGNSLLSSLDVTHLSSPSGVGSTASSGHQAGLDVSVSIPASIRSASAGADLTSDEQSMIDFVVALSQNTPPGVHIDRIVLDNPKIIHGVNARFDSVVATRDAAFHDEMFVSIAPPSSDPPALDQAVVEQDIGALIDRLDELFDGIEDTQSLPGVGSTEFTAAGLSDLIDVRSILQAAVLQPTVSMFADSTPATSDDLTAALDGYSATVDGYQVQVDVADHAYSESTAEMAFRIVVDVTGTRTQPLDFGPAAMHYSLEPDGSDTIDVQVDFQLDFWFGYDTIEGSTYTEPGFSGLAESL